MVIDVSKNVNINIYLCMISFIYCSFYNVANKQWLSELVFNILDYLQRLDVFIIFFHKAISYSN